MGGATTTHALGGLVHTLDGRSSAIIQEQRLLPVVVVGLQDEPPAQFQVDAEARGKIKQSLLTLSSQIMRSETETFTVSHFPPDWPHLCCSCIWFLTRDQV